MITMMRNADKMFQKLGYEKIVDNKYNVEYKDRFGHTIHMFINESGEYVAHSFDNNMSGGDGWGHVSYPMDINVLKACIKKIKEIQKKER